MNLAFQDGLEKWAKFDSRNSKSRFKSVCGEKKYCTVILAFKIKAQYSATEDSKIRTNFYVILHLISHELCKSNWV